MTKMLSLILFNCIFCFAQEDQDQHEDIALLSKGIAICEVIDNELRDQIESLDTTTQSEAILRYDLEEMRENLCKKSLLYFDKLIQKYPESRLYYIAMYNKAWLQRCLEEDDDAKISYLTVINNIDTTQEYYSKLKRPSLTALADIEINRKNYSQAIEYLNAVKNRHDKKLSQLDQKYQEIELSRLYGRAFIGLKNDVKAFEYLLPTIFEYKQGSDFVYMTIYKNDENVRLAASLIKKLYTPEKARELFGKASKKIYYDPAGKYYYIKFLNTKVEAYSGLEYSELDGTQKDAVAKNIENSLFKKLLNE